MTAVLEAGARRFRPVMLTSLTTFAGLTPLLLEKSTQAKFLQPMAISLGFGTRRVEKNNQLTIYETY